MSVVALPLPTSRAPSEHRERTILEHRGLCRRGVRRYLREGVERCDLEQVASIGLIKAADRYDPRTGTPFAAFAWIMILSELGHYVRDRERLVRPPRRVRKLERSYCAMWERLAQTQQCEPSEPEIFRALHARGDEARDLAHLRAITQPARLDDPLDGEARDVSGGDLDAIDRVAAAGALRAVGGDERRVLIGLYWCEMSLAEIGLRMGRSPRVVARLHRNALNSIRRNWAVGQDA